MQYYVTGAGGMLGKAVVEELAYMGVDHTALRHNDCAINDRASVDKALRNATDADVIINCSGVRPGGDRVSMVMANSVGPKVLADFSREHRVVLVHVSTDCVFSGNRGNYRYDDRPDPIDIYGRSKTEGENIITGREPSYLITIARTSFIGLDHGLLRWYLDEMTAGKRINGWLNAKWSGSTVWEVARALIRIGFQHPGGIQHLAMEEPVSKYDVLRKAANCLSYDVTRIRRTKVPVIDRSMQPTIILPPLDKAFLELSARVGEVWLPA